MEKIGVMVNGLPGNVAEAVAKQVIKDDRLEIIPYSLTGPEINRNALRVNDVEIHLITPGKRRNEMAVIINKKCPFYYDRLHPPFSGK